MKILALTVVATVAAGCLGTPADDGNPLPKPGAIVQAAPWWEVGEFWTIEMTRGNAPPETFNLVNFWNDSQTNHFWLGVANRGQALDMALHDDNPLLGRIHWGILTPHESGIHAHGIYTFPVTVGDEFGGLAFGEQWSLRVEEGERPGQLLFEGTSTDRSTIRYDFLEENDWFSFLEVKDRAGGPKLRLDVVEHGEGATGAYWFLRGRDYYKADDPSGTHEEKFTVKEEEIAQKSLAIEIRGTASGLLRIDLLDPTGAARLSETLRAGDVNVLREISGPALGEWTVRFVGTGSLDGTVEAVGILEYTRTL